MKANQTHLDALAKALLQCKMISRPAGADAWARRLWGAMYEQGVTTADVVAPPVDDDAPKTKWTDRLLTRSDD